MSKPLIFIGMLLVLIGIGWPWIKKLNLGHLPGDIVIKKENFSFYFPIVTCLLISLIFSFIFWIINRK